MSPPAYYYLTMDGARYTLSSSQAMITLFICISMMRRSRMHSYRTVKTFDVRLAIVYSHRSSGRTYDHSEQRHVFFVIDGAAAGLYGV